jgi:cellulase
MECIQVRVTSSGSAALPAGVAIPGTYSATDPGVLFDLYTSATSYPIPGPRVWNGANGSVPAPAPSPAALAPAPTTTSAAPVAPAPTTQAAPPTTPTTLSTAVRPAPTSGGVASTKVVKYAQCGGINYTGSTACEDGLECKLWNPYYAQCIDP